MRRNRMTVQRIKRRYRLKNTKKARIQAIVVLLGCIILLGGIIQAVKLLLPVTYIDARVTQIDGIPLYTDFLTPEWRGRTEELRRIKWLVIHETGNSAPGTDAAMHNKYLHNEDQKDIPLSWHYTVDDHQIYHHLPDSERGYHASDSGVNGGGNDCGIGIEICVNEDGDFDQAVDNAAHLAAKLLKQYHLSISDVKQHGDFTSKNCPEHLREGDNYKQFLKQIKKYM